MSGPSLQEASATGPRAHRREHPLRQANLDRELAQQLRRRAATTPDFWTFEGEAEREHGHGLFAYPAMMVPQLQGALLEDLLTVDPDVSNVYDPFMGSGTVLLESIRRGLSFTGRDVNPLAVLISKVKSNSYDLALLHSSAEHVLERASSDRRQAIAVDFHNRDKWFRTDVSIELSRLRRAIQQLPEDLIRQALWVTFAETIRLVSNSRTSTVKLHAYDETETANRSIDVFGTFSRVLRQHCDRLAAQSLAIAEGRKRNPTFFVHCERADARDHPHSPLTKSDVIMTSPPYGDNITTVTYGQHSYLPLQWIDHSDVPGFSMELLRYTRSIDSASLGGVLKGALENTEHLRSRSSSFGMCLDALADRPRNAQLRLVAFFNDLDAALGSMLMNLRSEGWMFWTLGERRISGVVVPTVAIVRDLLADRGARHVETLERKIPKSSKRMAARNARVETMTSESILVMQGPAGDHPQEGDL
ncbi:hypothetical protein ACIP98_19835 [Streptomyces sp. NPDC088354]|uniref:hypothetical protein n=1 Tax=Streptomyces sp. NPDC088354 TaxID=3365856 RepID=UPI0038084FDB